jgi:ABC-type spermidine/putrescine transport system permease subunit I
VEIQSQFKTIGNWPLGAALSLLMLMAFLACYGLTALALRVKRLDRIDWVS